MEKRQSELARTGKRLLAELIVVFLGVYGAFWVEDYRDRQVQSERTAQVLGVLQQDLRDYIDVTGGFYEHVREGLDEWSQARERGEHPPPFVFRIYGAETPPVTTWQAIQEAELAQLLEANLLYELAYYYNELAGWGGRMARYSAFTESQVLPMRKGDSRAFYSVDGSSLLPRFDAHMDRLREHRRFMLDTTDWATCILQRLESIAVSTDPCRTDVGVTTLR